MKVAIIGSRDFGRFDLSPYLPEGITEIISGGATGVDTYAKQYAFDHNIKYTEFRPKYNLFGIRAPLLRNITIIEHAEKVIAFWDGKSPGTRFVIEKCLEKDIPLEIYMPKQI